MSHWPGLNRRGPWTRSGQKEGVRVGRALPFPRQWTYHLVHVAMASLHLPAICFTCQLADLGLRKQAPESQSATAHCTDPELAQIDMAHRGGLYTTPVRPAGRPWVPVQHLRPGFGGQRQGLITPWGWKASVTWSHEKDRIYSWLICRHICLSISQYPLTFPMLLWTAPHSCPRYVHCGL